MENNVSQKIPSSMILDMENRRTIPATTWANHCFSSRRLDLLSFISSFAVFFLAASVSANLQVVEPIQPPIGSLELAAQDEWFRSNIAPIFQAHCLRCHNSRDRAADFSLESKEDLFANLFVDTKNPASSRLLEVVCSADATPPEMPKTGDPLSVSEVASLRQWILSGAEWPPELTISERVVDNFDWWSLQPIQRPPIPLLTSTPADWRTDNPIDAFVLAKMLEHGLTPNPIADRRTLIRRLTYDLTGLPPTPAEVQAFLDDPADDAYERLVDRLLLSPRYGERWGRHWLDLVRYADTCGYDKDKPRPYAWPYRDYVIRSINEDKPYSQFVEEQIAGDVLYPGVPDGILGLGFLAAGPWDFIGHVEVSESKLDGKEARNLDRDEFVSATYNIFCSTTVQCARCHNHKFDPITQSHYYDLQTVFAAIDRANRVYQHDPAIEAQRLALSDKREKLLAETTALNQTIATAGGAQLTELEQQIRKLQRQLVPTKLPLEYGYHSQIANSASVEKWVELQWEQAIEISEVELHACYDDFAGIGPGFGFPLAWTLTAVDERDQSLVLHVSDILSTSPRVIHPVVVKLPNPIRVHRLRLTARKLQSRDRDFNFAMAELRVLNRAGESQTSEATISALDSIEAPVRWQKENLVDGIWPEYEDSELASSLSRLAIEYDEIVRTILTPEIQSQQSTLSDQLADCEREIASLPSGDLVYAATTEFSSEGEFRATSGQPRDVRVLHRGNIGQPAEVAFPGTIPLRAGEPTRFPLAPGHGEGARRAALARWITDRHNPLTWRSIVNRIWLHHFGRGLVDSPNDFGRMGQLPSHPELLDWLATEFLDQKQSFRHLHRLIVTSAVYQQTSDSQPAAASIDGDNGFLWRANRRRLDAEEIRDSMLWASGALNLEMGGPGYYLFDLQKSEHSPHYEYHLFDPQTPATHRRSVYRFVVRSQPDPLMTTLDCADSSISVPQRDETLTALQALTLLNNPFALAMAEQLAGRLERADPLLVNQIRVGFELTAGRPPTPDEADELLIYARNHGLTNLCRMLFNMNEFVFID